MLLSVLLTLIWSGLWARPYPVRLWQIGKADGSSSEFALDGDSYSDISNVSRSHGTLHGRAQFGFGRSVRHPGALRCLGRQSAGRTAGPLRRP